MDLSKVKFVRAVDIVSKSEFWKTVLEIARISTVNRIVRTGQIMGRKDSEMQSAAQIFYPCMQAADIFALGADITQLGMDQKKSQCIGERNWTKTWIVETNCSVASYDFRIAKKHFNCNRSSSTSN